MIQPPDSEEPLTAAELMKLRQMILSEQRAVWLWATVKVWATWIAAVAVGITLGWDVLKKLVAALKS